MELLVYTTPEFVRSVTRDDQSDPDVYWFGQILSLAGARISHASEEFGTMVVDMSDEDPAVHALFARAIEDEPDIRKVEPLKYQVRVNLRADFAEAARNNPADPAFRPVADILKKYNATIKSQFDAFADFCREAEEAGKTDSTLYKWTKATIEKPGKKEQYATRFTVYADGGQEVYDKAIADGLEADLRPLMATGAVTRLNKFNTDPAQNPQAGPQFG